MSREYLHSLFNMYIHNVQTVIIRSFVIINVNDKNNIAKPIEQKIKHKSQFINSITIFNSKRIEVGISYTRSGGKSTKENQNKN